MHYNPITYLPWKPLREFAKGEVIFDQEQPSDSLYVVIEGVVKITITAITGSGTISRIVAADGLFGDACLAESSNDLESAVALDRVTVMAWIRDEIESQIDREPGLAIAL